MAEWIKQKATQEAHGYELSDTNKFMNHALKDR